MVANSDNQQMREMFLGAIKLQEELIADSHRRIEHYNWALSEMTKQEDEANKIIDVEPADPKMLEICNAIVKDCA